MKKHLVVSELLWLFYCHEETRMMIIFRKKQNPRNKKQAWTTDLGCTTLDGNSTILCSWVTRILFRRHGKDLSPLDYASGERSMEQQQQQLNSNIVCHYCVVVVVVWCMVGWDTQYYSPCQQVNTRLWWLTCILVVVWYAQGVFVLCWFCYGCSSGGRRNDKTQRRLTQG